MVSNFCVDYFQTTVMVCVLNSIISLSSIIFPLWRNIKRASNQHIREMQRSGHTMDTFAWDIFNELMHSIENSTKRISMPLQRDMNHSHHIILIDWNKILRSQIATMYTYDIRHTTNIKLNKSNPMRKTPSSKKQTKRNLLRYIVLYKVIV